MVIYLKSLDLIVPRIKRGSSTIQQQHGGHIFFRGDLHVINMELEDDSSTDFIPEHLLRILTAIENDGTHLPWELIHNSSSFTMIVNFRAKGNDKGKQPPLKKRASGVNFASQHTDKKRQDSSDVRLAEKRKRKKKKKTPAHVARDRARRKAYWKNIKVARKLPLRTSLRTKPSCRKQGR